MVFVKKVGNEWVVCIKTCARKSGRGGGQKIYRDWFFVKYYRKRAGYFCLGRTNFLFPEEFIGKKVKFTIEVVEEKKRCIDE